MTSNKQPRLTVYGRAWCHLCDDLLTGLRPICDEFGAEIEIPTRTRILKSGKPYGERVPVVLGGGIELCRYFLDSAAIRAYLLNFR